MAFIDTKELKVWERLPGWRGRYYHSDSMTFSTWDFEENSSIHVHHHPQEEVWYVIEGELEVTIAGETRVAGPGMAAIVPPNTPHGVKAITGGSALVVDHPLRREEPQS